MSYRIENNGTQKEEARYRRIYQLLHRVAASLNGEQTDGTSTIRFNDCSLEQLKEAIRINLIQKKLYLAAADYIELAYMRNRKQEVIKLSQNMTWESVE